MVRDNRHDNAYIFGAICPGRAIGAALITPVANTECMNLHLAEISRQLTPGSVAAIICDGAGWHATGRDLRPNFPTAHQNNVLDQLLVRPISI